MGIVSAILSIKTRLRTAKAALVSGFFAILRAYWKGFDVRDYLVYGGLLSIGYGFWKLFPWLGFVSLGVVSMLLGLGWLFRVKK